MKYKHVICWIRRDLRLHDHVALAEATRQSEWVTVVFIFDTRILDKLYDKDDKRLTFIHETLLELDHVLRDRNSGLVVRHGDAQEEIPKLAKQLKAQAVFVNRDYQPAAKKRDQEVKNRLGDMGVDFLHYKDQVIFEGLEVKKGSGEAYRVFTPYKNTWLSQLSPNVYREHKPELNKWYPLKNLKPHLKSWDLKKIGFTKADLWLAPGVKAARKRLKKFESHMDDYATQRNYPDNDAGTSGLSVHLRFGTVSIRELVRFAKEFRSEGARTWLSELIWRDFYQMILDQFPYVAKGAFKQEYDHIQWPGKEEHFEAWKQGMTGFPIVDAAMRHFNQTGWMHNRLRMIVASFLTKDLLIHWRKGERWFARKLLDYDMAANNGGWQWSASTGCDAQPYFRIFNPVSQSEKFDPTGDFIRQHIPELKNAEKDVIHWPHEEIPYTQPLVDHSTQRIKALGLFKRLK